MREGVISRSEMTRNPKNREGMDFSLHSKWRWGGFLPAILRDRNDEGRVSFRGVKRREIHKITRLRSWVILRDRNDKEYWFLFYNFAGQILQDGWFLTDAFLNFLFLDFWYKICRVEIAKLIHSYVFCMLKD